MCAARRQALPHRVAGAGFGFAAAWLHSGAVAGARPPPEHEKHRQRQVGHEEEEEEEQEGSATSSGAAVKVIERVDNEHIWTVPNMLTMVRIVAAPGLAYAVLQGCYPVAVAGTRTTHARRHA